MSAVETSVELPFPDRAAAGRALAARLSHLRGEDVVVLALPRGGVPVAAEIARALEAPLDLMLVRKVGFPGHEELALGAIAGPEGAEWVENAELRAGSGLDDEDVARLIERQRAELLRRRAAYLGDRAAVPLEGRVAVLVDDGVATGATIRAAAKALRRAGPKRVVIAVPVAADEVLPMLKRAADEVICLANPRPFVAVGLWYASFPQVSDDEVLGMLRAAG